MDSIFSKNKSIDNFKMLPIFRKEREPIIISSKRNWGFIAQQLKYRLLPRYAFWESQKPVFSKARRCSNNSQIKTVLINLNTVFVSGLFFRRHPRYIKKLQLKLLGPLMRNALSHQFSLSNRSEKSVSIFVPS